MPETDKIARVPPVDLERQTFNADTVRSTTICNVNHLLNLSALE